MLSKTITYTDYNGTERTETFIFNLTQTEVVELEFGKAGGLVESLTKIVDAKDAPQIMAAFKEIISKAYGEKSEDGRRLMKGSEISRNFMETEAYNVLFMELFASSDKDAASKFVNAIIPDPIPQNTGNVTQMPQSN